MTSDFSDFTGIEPKDITKISINAKLPSSEKKARYTQETGSNVFHKVGETQVKCNFGDMDIEKILEDLIY